MTVDTVKHVFGRWGEPVPAREFSEKARGQLLALSLAVDAMFGGSAEAERAWMTKAHPELGTAPINLVRAGQIEAVIDQTDKERNLS